MTSQAPAPRSTRESLRPVLGLLGEQRRLVRWVIGFGLAGEGLLIAAGGVAAYLVGASLTGTAAGDLVSGVVALAACVPLIVLFQGLETYWAHRMSFWSHDQIRTSLFDAFDRLAPAYFIRRRSGDVATAATSDVELLELYTSHHLPTRVVATVVPVLATIGLGVLHPVLLVALAPFLVLLATLPSWLRARAATQGHEILDRGGALAADLVDAVQGLREIVAFGAQDVQLGRIETNARTLGRARIAHGRRGGFEKAVSDTLVSLGLLAVVGVAAWLVTAGSLAPWAYPPAVVLAAAAFVPLAQVTGVGRELNRVAAAADRITGLLDEPATVTDSPTAARAAVSTPRIGFDHVSFRYTADLPDALREVSFAVEPGETVALVGHSGAGKSTCANLLLRLWDPATGTISIGGRDLRTLPLAQIPELVAYIPQDVYLFNGDVLDNIRIGRHDATDAEAEQAARTAQASDFIEALPRGYRTQLGERGARLSGGQRQRLAIARAILSPAPILVMDEAVSSLDTESELALHRAVTDLGGHRTILIIAHRPSTIRTADRIVVLRDGRVVDTGSYVDLLASGGPFAALVSHGIAP